MKTKLRPIGSGYGVLLPKVTYLEMNGFRWNCGEVEETAMMLGASAKEMTQDEWEAWVIRNVRKKD
jgi:hypothetical protein